MSRFEAAAKKAAGGVAPKTAAKAKAAVPSVLAKPKAAPPKLTTLEDKKKFVKTWEMKIDDKDCEVQAEANKKAKKDLETALKKLQTDETYLKVKEEIKEMELQGKRDAERAALTASKTDAKAATKTEKKVVATATEASEEALKEVETALASSGKDAASAKASALATLEKLSSATAFVLPKLPQLVELFADSKLGAPAQKAALAIVTHIQPRGHGVASEVMPILLKGMQDKRWKVKAACIDVLLPCLHQMFDSTPAQMAGLLPQILQVLAEAALEVRAEIRSATGAVLREIGTLVASPEIKKLSQDLVTALAEPTNQKHTQDVLARMGNQTFMSLIDAASLSLLMPIVVRGLREREPASKKWSAQIFGSTSQLVQTVDFMKPYLPMVVPMLEQALFDPVSEVKREAAKTFGVMEQVLPSYSQRKLLPWLFGKLRGGEQGEQTGCALALAETLFKMDKELAASFVGELQAGATDPKTSVRRGFLELMDTMPQAMKMDFVPYIEALFPAMLMGITGDKDQNEDPGHRAALALVQRFGDLCPDRLLDGFEGAYCCTLQYGSPEEAARVAITREKTVSLLGKVAEKILEHKKFGQDLLTTEDCSNKATRERLLVLIFLARSDADAAVKRVANGLWKTAGGAPKVQKAIMPSISKLLQRLRQGERGAAAQKLALEVLDQLVKSGDLEAPEGDVPEAPPFTFPPPAQRAPAGSLPALVVMGQVVEETKEEAGEQGVDAAVAASKAREVVNSNPHFAKLVPCVRDHLAAISASIVVEGQKNKHFHGRKQVATMTEDLTTALTLQEEVGEAPPLDKLPAVCEDVVRAVIGDAFDAHAEGGDADDEMLLRVENLLLMYGAGHLLLKDTTLEMRKNCRYGVVGHNGAGKTTLMKEIAAHRIVGMPMDLKCVHVDDSKLGEMSKSYLNALEYCIKMAKDIGVNDAGRETLLKVGFDDAKLNDPVSELSTGWRMRLTLAVSMLKHADLVLLDEPTNHLDEQSVQWLSDYILSITSSSVMVISHEPKFLNKICTHVVAYVDKKLEYTEGNFDVFAMKKGLSREQIDAMLSGNLSFDTKKEGDEDDDAGDAPKVSAPVAGPPKLSFPIPGSMEGVKTGSKSVLELRHVSFRYSKDKDYLLENCSGKLSLSSRVAITGRNGCGKSTLMTLLCSELTPSENKDGSHGEVWRHHNLRLAYMKQDHLKALGPFFDTSPFVYITERFKEGFDGDLQRRLVEPEDEEEGLRRKELAKQHGKYGNEVAELVSRTKVGNHLSYEVRWAGLDDPKQNTLEPISKLKTMGLDKVIIACDERIAAKAAGLDQRPLTRREIVRHCEAFGIDEEMCCNRQIRGFSAGQKVRLSLAAMFWTKPHFIAVDEPTNYLDVETVDALGKALTTFRGGIVMIEPKTDFVERICNEKWVVEDGKMMV
eukprot:CAMPEP_0181409902 /NCGR_PEP_ID=MMETSP1110-20121109/7063_1 /TAXON_ID=174948 /ORGANISM="Symbiodinium sp., Strain CCMP421" /LENGTH=1412 /DNA_ID=CAMNT_0023532433 /DNA_START=36 /DNA_END=4271 /DNA_ORIENTATION=+